MPKVQIKFSVEEMYDMLPKKSQEVIDSMVKNMQQMGCYTEKEIKDIIVPAFFHSYMKVLQEGLYKLKIQKKKKK